MKSLVDTLNEELVNESVNIVVDDKLCIPVMTCYKSDPKPRMDWNLRYLKSAEEKDGKFTLFLGLFPEDDYSAYPLTSVIDYYIVPVKDFVFDKPEGNIRSDIAKKIEKSLTKNDSYYVEKGFQI